MTDYLELFNDSYEALLGRDREGFFRDFYNNFMSKSDEIAQKFSNTDLDRQGLMLKKSLAYMVNFFANNKSSEYLEEIARLHDAKHLNIRPELYGIWIDSLLETVETRLHSYKPEIGLSWRIVMAPGIEFMKFHFSREPGK